MIALGLAYLHSGRAGHFSSEDCEIVVRAATYATIPGKQKRNAAYMLKAREDAVKAACRALRRAK